MAWWHKHFLMQKLSSCISKTMSLPWTFLQFGLSRLKQTVYLVLSKKYSYFYCWLECFHKGREMVFCGLYFSTIFEPKSHSDFCVCVSMCLCLLWFFNRKILPYNTDRHFKKWKFCYCNSLSNILCVFNMLILINDYI